MKAQQALDSILEFKAAYQRLASRPCSPEEHGTLDRMSTEAAERFGEAFDEECQRGLEQNSHDKWYAMGRISSSGCSHAYSYEETLSALDMYAGIAEEWTRI